MKHSWNHVTRWIGRAPTHFYWTIIVAASATVILRRAIDLLGGVERLHHILSQTGSAAPLLFLAIKAMTYIVAPLGGGPIKAIGGALFGLQEGMVLSLAGDVLGGSCSFLTSRRYGSQTIRRISGAEAARTALAWVEAQ